MKTRIHLAWMVALPICAALLSAVFKNISLLILMLLLVGEVIALISIIVPIRLLGFTKRSAALISVITIFSAMIVSSSSYSEHESIRMSGLKISDPAAYALLVKEKTEEESIRKARADAREVEKLERVRAKNKKMIREKSEAARERADEARRAKEEKKKGFHCLSAWDGSHNAFKRDVKENMRNPKSFEHIETRVTPESSSGEHMIVMQYRAENGFGGMVVGTATGSFRNNDCAHVVIAYQ